MPLRAVQIYRDIHTHTNIDAYTHTFAEFAHASNIINHFYIWNKPKKKICAHCGYVCFTAMNMYVHTHASQGPSPVPHVLRLLHPQPQISVRSHSGKHKVYVSIFPLPSVSPPTRNHPPASAMILCLFLFFYSDYSSTRFSFFFPSCFYLGTTLVIFPVPLSLSFSLCACVRSCVCLRANNSSMVRAKEERMCGSSPNTRRVSHTR